MRNHYQKWAEHFLSKDEENIASFSHFLTKEVGSKLRFDGLVWLASAVISNKKNYWRSNNEINDTMTELLSISLANNAMELRRNAEVREAFLQLAGFLVARGSSTALAIQERAKLLRG